MVRGTAGQEDSIQLHKTRLNDRRPNAFLPDKYFRWMKETTNTR